MAAGIALERRQGSVKGLRNVCWWSCVYPIVFFLFVATMLCVSVVFPIEQHSITHHIHFVGVVTDIMLIVGIGLGALGLLFFPVSLLFLVLGLIGRILNGERDVVLAALTPLLLWSAWFYFTHMSPLEVLRCYITGQ